MSAQETKAGGRMQSAIDELQSLILRRYPSAQFHVGESPDDAEIVQLNTIVDVDDLDAVLDTVIDRMMEIQIEDGLPIFVVATRPAQRANGDIPSHTASPSARPAGAALLRER